MKNGLISSGLMMLENWTVNEKDESITTNIIYK